VILYFKLPWNIAPSFIVDVSDYADKRLAAIYAYRSQLYNPESREPATTLTRPNFLTDIDNIHSYYGTIIGKRKGEAFHYKGVLEIPDLIQHFALSGKKG